jgi:16S rRNA (cytidine1402-2'-O)-methyltransferase
MDDMTQENHLKPGKLYLIPVGLSGQDYENVLPAFNYSIMHSLDEFIVENVRSARRFLRSTGYTGNFETVTFHVLDKHTSDNEIPSFLLGVLKGKNVGLLSEAGNPCIADPGNKVVRLAHRKNLQIIPLTGPSSILLALISSGFNGQNFAFHGYLPVDKKARQNRIKELQQLAVQKNQTQIFMETPFRNNALLEDVLQTCNDHMMLCIAAEISTASESIRTKSIKYWKEKTPDLHKKPSVFLLYKDEA